MANEDGSSKAATFSEMEGPVAELQQEQGSGLITAAAGSSATKIKLKLPKLPGVPTDAAVKEFSHICKECGKGFSSGKALGGHMSSAHVQAKDKLKSRRSLDGESDDEKHMCGICHKEFPSSKSLYGHMRLHPERQWRGMEPPDHPHPHRMVPFRSARQMLDGGDEDDYGIDGLDFLDEVEGLDTDPDDKIDPAEYDMSDHVGSGWGTTGRRGQKLGVQTFDFADIADKEEKEMVIRAARELVMLARGPPTPTPVTQVNDASFTPSAESAKNGKFTPKNRSNRLVIYSSSSSSGDDSEETLVDGSLHEKSPADSASSSFGRDLDDGSARIKRRKLDKKTPNEAQQFLTTPQPETYICTTCNKSFSSHQALGGHRSSHNKVKIHVQNAVEQVDMEDLRSGPFARLPEIERASSDALKVSSDQIFGYLHECEICGKSFPTGQALGGHKRCHYAAVSSSAAHSPSTPDGIGGERSERKVHEFDLNAFPVEDGCDNIS